VAVVGDAYVVVRAITTNVKSDIQKAFSDVDKIGQKAGQDINRGIKRGMRGGGGNNNFLSGLSSQFGGFIKESERAKEKFTSLTRLGYFLAPAIVGVAAAIGNLGANLLTLVGIAGASLPALAGLGTALFGLGQVALTLGVAFRGVSAAISAGIKAQTKTASQAREIAKAELALKRAKEDLAILEEDAAYRSIKSLKAISDAQRELNLEREKAREQLQQLAFDSEDAAINEQKAALELEKARETLARVSDLPPNSRARKEAELAFAEADLNYRRAIDKNNDLKKTEAKNAAMGDGSIKAQVEGQQSVIDAVNAVSDAQHDAYVQNRDDTKAIQRAREDIAQQEKDLDYLKKGGAAADAYADALNKLSKSAQEFVKYIVSLKGVVKDLQEAAGKEFFPLLQKAIQNLIDNLLPTIKPLLTETGRVLGEFALKLSKAFTTPENLKRLEAIWKSNNISLTNLGDAASNLVTVFMILFKAASPLVEEFTKYLAVLTGSWKKTLELQEANGELAKKFEIARGILKDLGTIFGNVFGGLGNIIKNVTGPGSGGQILLDYLKDVTGSFRNLEKIDGKPLKEFFVGAAENGKELLGLLGKIVGALIGLADDPGVGEFFKILKGAVGDLAAIGGNLTASLPSFGTFVAKLVEFTKIVTDSGTIKIFFDVLSAALQKVIDFLKTDLGQKILDITNRILPFVAAFALIGEQVLFFFQVIVGAIAGPIKAVASLVEGWGALSAIFAEAGLALGPVLAVFAAVVASLILMWQNSELFRNAVKDLVVGVGTALYDAFKKIFDALSMLKPFWEGFKNIFGIIGDAMAPFIIIIKTVLVVAINLIATAIASVIKAVALLGPAFELAVKIIRPIFGILAGLATEFAKGISFIFVGLSKLIGGVFDGVIGAVKFVLNGLIDLYNKTLGKLNFKLPGFLGGGTLGFPQITKLAQGGVVQPTPGGMIAQIAEAGRPERVEPLDSQGLSVRDRAIIAELSAKSGGTGNAISITVNPAPGMNERELAAIVSRELSYQLRRGAA